MSTRLPVLAVEHLVGGHAAVRAAARTGVLERLSCAPSDPASLAAATGLDARLLAALLRALAALGVVAADPAGRYRAVPQTAAVLALLDGAFAGLDEALRGRPPPDRVDTVEGATARYPSIVPLLGAVLTEAAKEVADRLARPGLRVLDAGAGGAPWSIALARREPTCRVVAVDLPGVLGATRAAAKAAGVADRFEFVAGDLFGLPLRAEHDLVIAGNLCHLFNPERTATLVARLAGALRPGGTLAIVDLPGDCADDPATAVYALGLVLRTSGGCLHDSGDFRRWLAAAGLVDVDALALADRGLQLFSGHRDGQPATVDRGTSTVDTT